MFPAAQSPLRSPHIRRNRTRDHSAFYLIKSELAKKREFHPKDLRPAGEAWLHPTDIVH